MDNREPDTALDDHARVVRRSFESQTDLFDGDDALFAKRSISLTSWLEPLSPDMIALDVACGAAHVAEQIAPHVRQVVGVDLTTTLLALGSDRLHSRGASNVLLQEASADSLPFVDRSFDLVVCRSALHHFADPERAVVEMARVCRPGGRVVVADMVAPRLDVRERFDDVHRAADPSHTRALLGDELVTLMEASVGSVTRADASERFTIPVDVMLTEVADRDAVMTALRAELSGGPETGFHPRLDGEDVVVSFASAVVHAVRPPP
jgi:ubiquinone/menaquinone biosynthesis C-methylase UbiE